MSGGLDPRVARGMHAMLATRRARLEAGDRRLGWKLAFGSPAGMEQLGISAPLVGFLVESGRIDDGGTCPVGRWGRPVVEAEVAAHLAKDVPPGSGREGAAAAIGALGPALEIVELSDRSTDVEEVLAANIYQRHVVLGRPSPGASLDGVSGLVLVNGREVARTEDPQEMPGELGGLVAHVADVLGEVGERLAAGEVVITGAVVPPIPVGGGEHVTFRLDPLGEVATVFSG
jgi:2-keto-4-pentenoate hydratase